MICEVKAILVYKASAKTTEKPCLAKQKTKERKKIERKGKEILNKLARWWCRMPLIPALGRQRQANL